MLEDLHDSKRDAHSENVANDRSIKVWFREGRDGVARELLRRFVLGEQGAADPGSGPELVTPMASD